MHDLLLEVDVYHKHRAALLNAAWPNGTHSIIYMLLLICLRSVRARPCLCRCSECTMPCVPAYTSILFLLNSLVGPFIILFSLMRFFSPQICIWIEIQLGCAGNHLTLLCAMKRKEGEKAAAAAACRASACPGCVVGMAGSMQQRMHPVLIALHSFN